ncbi:MAG TPA: hypothetical protein VFN49_02035 [Candidatus Aquilonibacter sp.]|nr:hypothetical protein [Candidatus Aquilonibacter sp.]
MATDPIQRNERISDADAHSEAMSLPINAVVRRLIALLGATTVATIGGVTETRAVAQWTDGRVPQRPNVLRFALQLASMIGDEANIESIRAWFAGTNPLLDDQVPSLMLRDRPLHEIGASMMAAARSFASR